MTSFDEVTEVLRAFATDKINGHPKLWRLFKYALSAMFVYFIFKTPVMLLLTELGRIHYVFSGALAGAVLTLIEFIPSEFWVWRRKGDPQQKET